jgi:hypothetical protein
VQAGAGDALQAPFALIALSLTSACEQVWGPITASFAESFAFSVTTFRIKPHATKLAEANFLIGIW